ncbi:MAG: hypothetical protein P4L92_02845 [Rudaea sp.]|nr:hypothetical protein [Rudaea sp.]
MQPSEVLIVKTSAHRVGLRIEVRGPGNYANTVAYWQTICAELGARPAPGLLLIDRTTGAPLSADEWKALVATIAGKGLEKTHIAHVKPAGLQRIEFCEIFAREAGIVARVFTDENEADLWLRYGERTPAT